ncbi:MAG: hypothetical protein LIP23_05750, partial [Planctomycetes bacterium]|nr:hypothetical protein [Planctomycetota bacterium]
ANWVDRIGADAVILTGMNYAQSLEYLQSGRTIIKPNKPIVLGGSVTIENIGEVLKYCDGAVVSTSLMLDNQPAGSLLHWDADKIRRFMDAAHSAVK